MESTACVRGGCGGAGKPPQRGEDCMGKAMVAKRTREIRPSGMTWGVSGNVSHGSRIEAHREIYGIATEP